MKSLSGRSHHYTQPHDKKQWLQDNYALWKDKDFYNDQTLLSSLLYKMIDADLYCPRTCFGEKHRIALIKYMSEVQFSMKQKERNSYGVPYSSFKAVPIT